MKIKAFIVVYALVVEAACGGTFAHYSFDTNYEDASGNARHGTLTDVGTFGNSGITTAEGLYKFGGGALTISADNDFVSLLPAAQAHILGSGTPYTISFWARDTAATNNTTAGMVMGDRNDNQNFIWLSHGVPPYGLRVRGANSTTAQAEFKISHDTEWHHYVIQAGDFNHTGSVDCIRLIRDGRLLSTITGKNTTFRLNTIGQAYTTGTFGFQGQIDEVWIFDEVLSAGEVASLYTSNNRAAGTPAPYYGFDHHYDVDFSDSGSDDNDGIASGTAAITTTPSAIATGAGALALDGSASAYVTLTRPVVYATGEPWTVAWWAKRAGFSDNGMVMGTAASTSSDFIWLNESVTGLRFRSSSGTDFNFTVSKDTALRHYALVADGQGHLSLYLNGQFYQTLNGNTPFMIDTVGKAYSTNSSQFNFQGSLDEIHVIPSALDATAIGTMYENEKPAVAPSPPISKLLVVLVGGQSNADGRAAPSGLPKSPVNLQDSQDDVAFFYNVSGGTPTLTTLRPGLSGSSQFGPEVTLGRRLADLHKGETGTRVALIKYAVGGTNLASQWKGGGDATTTGDGSVYTAFQTTVTQGLATLAAAHPSATIEIQGMVWFQGEGDANASYAAAYQTNLTKFIADIRTTYGENLPFIIARLSSAQTTLNATYLNLVRAAQDAVAAADPYTGIIYTDTFKLASDNLHFNADGQQDIGRSFAREVAYHAWMKENFTPQQIAAGLGAPSADADGDTITNLDEFLSATDPKSNASVFRASFTKTGADTGIVSYGSSVARNYTIERLVIPGLTWETLLPAKRGTGSREDRAVEASEPIGIFRVRADIP